MNMMYLAPAICLVFGIVGIIQTIRFYRQGGSIKLSTLIMALVGIPAFVACLLQIFGIIDNDQVARVLGTEYVMERMERMEAQNNQTESEVNPTEVSAE